MAGGGRFFGRDYFQIPLFRGRNDDVTGGRAVLILKSLYPVTGNRRDRSGVFFQEFFFLQSG